MGLRLVRYLVATDEEAALAARARAPVGRPAAGEAGPAEWNASPCVGILTGAGVLDPASTWVGAEPFPSEPLAVLADEMARRHAERVARDPVDVRRHPLEKVWILPPVARPTSFRDFYAFEEHVRNARARRGLGVPEEWYRIPVFYFSNHSAILGPGDEIRAPGSTRQLDFELEIGCVIGRAGRDISVEEAPAHIAGFTVLNDWSARDLQAEEMKVGLGPSKGKDFATSIGPALVTPDEIASTRSGKGYELSAQARRNGRVLSRGSWKSIHWSFEEMIAHASRDAGLFPGDLLGSGTIGTGCILELGPESSGGWLAKGDVVELEIEGLGILSNRIT